MLFQSNRDGFKAKLRIFFQAHRDTLLFVLIIFVGVSSIFVSFYSLRSAIYSPYASSGDQEVAAAVIEQKDTDGDGLYDNDELTAYGTSPYLKDTDSDGKDDAEEIAAGKNPNCPEGQTCTGVVASQPTPPATPTTQLPAGIPQSAAQLREALRKGGASDDLLNAMTDEQLLAEYQKAITNITQKNTGPSSTPIASSNLTAAQIRELLRANGVTEEKLLTFTDEDLINIYQQTLVEVENKPATP